MALTMLKAKTSVGLMKRMYPTIIQASKHSWEPKEVETHTGQVSCFAMALTRITLYFCISYCINIILCHRNGKKMIIV